MVNTKKAKEKLSTEGGKGNKEGLYEGVVEGGDVGDLKRTRVILDWFTHEIVDVEGGKVIIADGIGKRWEEPVDDLKQELLVGLLGWSQSRVGEYTEQLARLKNDEYSKVEWEIINWYTEHIVAFDNGNVIIEDNIGNRFSLPMEGFKEHIDKAHSWEKWRKDLFIKTVKKL